jgi:hypothetical protein
MVRRTNRGVKGGFHIVRATVHAAQALSARRRSVSARMPQNPGMAPPLPDDPVLPGATWRPLAPQDAATLAALVGAVALYERVGFTVNRRFVRLRRPVAV